MQFIVYIQLNIFMLKSKALRNIEKLNPQKDAWEIVRLSMHYEFPWDFNRALELSLYKTYAVPSIAKTLSTTNELTKRTQKRYDDTDLILSEIIEYGIEDKNGRGWRALQQMNFIHSKFNISNDDYLYVLGTFIFGIYDWINLYGYRKLIPSEELAGFYVWKKIGEQMFIKDIPDSFDEFRKFYDEYEIKNFKYTPQGASIAHATENLMLSWVLPNKHLYESGRPFLHAAMPPHLLKAFNHKEPGTALRTLVTQFLRTRSKTANLLFRDKPYIRTRDHYYPTYPNGYDIEKLGPTKLIDTIEENKKKYK